MAAILVACLASFRAFFTKSKRPSHERTRVKNPKAVISSAPKLALLFTSRFTVTSLFDKFSRTVNDLPSDDDPSLGLQQQTTDSSIEMGHCDGFDGPAIGSSELVIPANKVHVRQDIHVT